MVQKIIRDDESFFDLQNINNIISEELIKKEKRKLLLLSDYLDMNKTLNPEGDLTGNDFLESPTLSNYEKSLILSKLVTNDFSRYLKPIDDCTEDELKKYTDSFPLISKEGADNLKFFNPEYNKSHLLFLNKFYHEFLNLENYKPAFVPKKLENAYTYFVLGAGPVGLVFSINALLRGCKVILVDNRFTDMRNRYIGIFPEFVVNLTNYGLAPSSFLKWVVLNATNDKTPKQRRQTNRLFLHIQALVRLLSLVVVKLGGKIYRNYEYDIKYGILTDKNTGQKSLYTDFDEIIVAVGCGKNDDLKKNIELNFNIKNKTPWEIATTLMKKMGNIDKAIKLFRKQPIMISRYIMGDYFGLAKDNLKRIMLNKETKHYINDLCNFQSFFIILPPEFLYDLNKSFVEQPLTLPPNWHVTGLKKIIKLEKNHVTGDFFHILIIGPMFADFARSCLKNEEEAIKVIAMHVLLNCGSPKTSNIDINKENISEAVKSKLSLIFGSRFSVFLDTQNIVLCINEKGRLADLKNWKPVSIGNCTIGENKEIKKYFLVGDILSSPWYKFGLGLSDGFHHIESYFKRGKKNYSIIKSEYNLTIRQLHIINSLMIVRKEFHENFSNDFHDLVIS